MKYSVTINQLAIIEAGFDFDLTDAAVFEVLRDLANSPACKRMQDSGRPFFSISYQKIIEELPLAGLKKTDSVYRRFQKLAQHAVIEMHPENKKLKQVWFTWGRNYDRMLFRYKTGSKSDQPDLNPIQTGFKSVLRPDQNPPHQKDQIPYNQSLGGIPPNPLAASDATLTVEAEKKEKKTSGAARSKRLSVDRIEVAQVVAYLNQLCGTNYKPDARATQNLVSARMRDGFTVKDFELVIAHKAREWLSDGKMREYLRPETLFGNKFEGYLNAARLSLQNPQQPQNGTSQNGKFAFDPHAALARAAELVAERRERLAARQ